MVAAPRSKSSDKQDSCKKLLTLLKKKYSDVPSPPELPVLETILFAVCLENCSVTEAQAIYHKLHASFHDLNEIRVSSIEELVPLFREVSDTDLRALRIRSVLQHLFETTYSFDFDGIKRKTLELATKQLSKVKSLTPFVRTYTLQSALGAHLLPFDDRMHNALVWLDLATHGETPEQTGEALRGAIRKADGPEFCQLIRAVATDPRYLPVFQTAGSAEQAEDERPPALRLEYLLKGDPHGGQKAAKKAPAKKAPEPVAPAKPAAARKKAPVAPKAAPTKPAADKKVKPQHNAPAPAAAAKKGKKPAARTSR